MQSRAVGSGPVAGRAQLWPHAREGEFGEGCGAGLELDHFHARHKCDISTLRAMNQSNLAAGGEDSSSLKIFK